MVSLHPDHDGVFPRLVRRRDAFVARFCFIFLTRKIPRQAIRDFLDGLSVSRRQNCCRAIDRDSG